MALADGRSAAWISAWKLLEAAHKVKSHIGIGQVSAAPLPELYWSLVAEAQVYSDLAKATESVGFLAGEWFQAEHEQELESRRMTESVISRLRDKEPNGD